MGSFRTKGCKTSKPSRILRCGIVTYVFARFDKIADETGKFHREDVLGRWAGRHGFSASRYCSIIVLLSTSLALRIWPLGRRHIPQRELLRGFRPSAFQNSRLLLAFSHA